MSEDDSIDDISPEELAEAEALAQALDRGHASPGLPEDVLGTAAMLRFSHGGGEIESERLDAIFEEVLKEAKVSRPEKAAGAWWRWLIPAGLVSAGAVAAALMLMPGAGPASLPPPPDGLLQAQAGALSGEAAELDRQMTNYRGAVFSALEDRYGR